MFWLSTFIALKSWHADRTSWLWAVERHSAMPSAPGELQDHCSNNTKYAAAAMRRFHERQPALNSTYFWEADILDRQ
jgi:hypothetical protein